MHQFRTPSRCIGHIATLLLVSVKLIFYLTGTSFFPILFPGLIGIPLFMCVYWFYHNNNGNDLFTLNLNVIHVVCVKFPFSFISFYKRKL